MSKNNQDILPFEQPLNELKMRIAELRKNAESTPGLQTLLESMQEQSRQAEKQLYEELSPWNTVQLARHPKRPQVRDYVENTFDDFIELHGDRKYRDDLSIVTGFANLGHHRVMLVGQHKGRNVEERHLCHAGCPHPEGYWKALKKMQLAEKYKMPVVCLIDTKGAYPGVGSEERGVAIAIAENLMEMSVLKVPVVCCVIGEGGSGGALGISVGDRILMLRHAYYSVISPEGCASILWRDGEKKAQASAILKLTSRDLKERGFIDEVVDEPLGGAHRDPVEMGKILRDTLIRNLDELVKMPVDELVEKRYQKFRVFGEWLEGQTLPDYDAMEAKAEKVALPEQTDEAEEKEPEAEEVSE
ncbi:MAG: acetyl-CoA carboxylase carboxyltransferase subunit alpha [Planctomycetes bacterium]|nr:acetyl-CoA carboxylase carboxyltransferase subunit alpha [Planctomycetota bacterium]